MMLRPYGVAIPGSSSSDVQAIAHMPLGRTPVIAVTALGSNADVMRTFEAGFNGHLTKPIDFHTIALALERVFWAHRPEPAR
jgi:CheY-like chemotaxis protein